MPPASQLIRVGWRTQEFWEVARWRCAGGTWAYLAGKQDCRGHLLHSQVPDAGRQGAPARRAAAQLLAALVTHQVPGLALQDGGQHIVKADRALEERGQLVVLRGHRPSPATAAGARDHRRRGGHRGRAGARSRDGGGGRGRSRGRSVLRLRRRLLAAGFVSAGAGGGRAAHRAPNQPWNCGRLPAAGPPGSRRCAPRGRQAPRQRHRAQPGTGQQKRPAPAGEGLDCADDLRGPRRSKQSSAPPDSSSRRRRGPRTRAVRRTPAHQLLERQLTQAPGARADVTPGHVCGRSGARGLAEPPCAGTLAPPESSWQRRGPPSEGLSCPGCGPARASEHARLAAAARGLPSGLGRRPPFGEASPKSSGHTPGSHAGASPAANQKDNFGRAGARVVGGAGCAPLDRSEKTERFLFPRVESPAREGRRAARAVGPSLERWVWTLSFGREQRGQGAWVGSAAGAGPSAGLLRVGLDHSLVLLPGVGRR